MAVRKPAVMGARTEAKERLLVEAAQKDPSRFAELYEANFERVYAYIVKRVRERHIAEDLTSDVFHKALAHLPNFDWRGIPFGAWLLRIASNVVTDQWRRSAKEVLVDNPPEVSVEASAEVNLQDIDDRARLFRMVDQLPAEQRRVIGMRFAEGKSIREIATEIGKTEGAVKQLQYRGLEALRAELETKPGARHA
jgi:RNA polymerase sigma-70 factor (ECF subfamily)